MTKFKELALFELNSISRASVNTPHKGDGFLGNRHVEGRKKKKKKKQGSIHSLFPSLESLALLIARQETTLETKVSAFDGLAIGCKTPLPATRSVFPLMKTVQL